MQNNLNSPETEIRVRQNEKGFSLLELLISMVLFLIVTGAVYGVLQVAQRSRSLVSQQSQLNKNVRIALSLIARDTYNAGYSYPLKNTVLLPDNRISTLLTIPIDFDTSRDTVPPIIAGNNITLNTYNSAANIKTDQVTFLFKDSTFNLTGTAPNQVSQPLNVNVNVSTTTTGFDEVVPISGNCNGCNVNDLFLVTGNTGSALALVTALGGTNSLRFSNSDVLGFNQTGSSGPLSGITTPAVLMRVRMITYFVAADGTLMRREYANVAPVGGAAAQKWVDEPLVYGVEDFQVKYILDDGTSTDNPSAGVDKIPGNADDEQASLAKTRQIRFTIFAKGTELNPSGKPYTVNMTSTFSTRNLGYDAN